MARRAGAVLRWLERMLFTIAALCLAAAALSVAESTYYHEAVRAVLDSVAPASSPARHAGDRTASAGGTASSPAALPDGERASPDARAGRIRNAVLVGEIEIPHLRVSAAVLEGDDAATLRRGAGHLPGTALPWEGGNAVLAGHRDTVFRRLGELQPGDRLRLRTLHGTFDYRVSRTMRVKPRDVWVLRSDAAALTLITCYPFSWVGSAPERWVVQAEKSGY